MAKKKASREARTAWDKWHVLYLDGDTLGYGPGVPIIYYVKHFIADDGADGYEVSMDGEDSCGDLLAEFSTLKEAKAYVNELVAEQEEETRQAIEEENALNAALE